MEEIWPVALGVGVSILIWPVALGDGIFVGWRVIAEMRGGRELGSGVCKWRRSLIWMPGAEHGWRRWYPGGLCKWRRSAG